MRKLVIAAATVACLVGLLGVPARATESPLSQSADASVCGEVTLSGTEGLYPNPDPDEPTGYLLHWFVEADPANAGNVALPGEKTVTFDEDYLGGEISVVYHSTGPESAENLAPEEVTVDTDCAEPVDPTVPDGTTTTTAPTTPTTGVIPVPPGDDAAPVAAPATPVVADPSFTG